MPLYKLNRLKKYLLTLRDFKSRLRLLLLARQVLQINLKKKNIYISSWPEYPL